MKVIAVTGQKGGSGKTTLSVNLAGYFASNGVPVAILDRDPQNAVRTWADQRADGELPFNIHDELDAKIPVILGVLKKADFKVCIIDTAPTVGGAFLEVPHYADLVLMPCRPSLLDIQSLVDSFAILSAKFPKVLAMAVLTQVTERLQITKKSEKVLSEASIRILNTRIGSRAIYQNTFSEGKTVFDSKKNHGAKEIQAIAEEIKILIGL
jgi:chromosome partitioning protein